MMWPEQIFLPNIDLSKKAIALNSRSDVVPAAALLSFLIAMTGYGQAQDRKQILAAAFDYCLEKPADTRRLATIIAKASRP